VAMAYLHPGADDLGSLQSPAARENNAEMTAFEAELRHAVPATQGR
jgi:hypothetical protein